MTGRAVCLLPPLSCFFFFFFFWSAFCVPWPAQPASRSVSCPLHHVQPLGLSLPSFCAANLASKLSALGNQKRAHAYPRVSGRSSVLSVVAVPSIRPSGGWMRGVDYWWGTEESGALDRPAWSGRLVRVVGRIVDSSTGCAVLVVARSLVCVRRARGGPPARNGLGRFVGRTRGNLCLTLFLSVLPGVSFVRGLSRTSLGDLWQDRGHDPTP
ncbi:hypothetical protein HDK90DRAFT_60814 [Phyllosticta capitalensis]|uniref:Secreted protein n=1 Tax=Phyllosticta capitalensis TaxID=121624 RepID=A0ABR1YFP4_9PEZI